MKQTQQNDQLESIAMQSKSKLTKTKILGNALLLLAAIIWGLAFVAQRVGMDKIEPLTFNAARTVLGAFAVGTVAAIMPKAPAKGVDPKLYKKDTIVGGVLCGIFLALASILQQVGIVSTSAGKAGFITAMYMLLVPILNFVLFRKKSPYLVWFAVLVGLIGMYCLCITEDFTLSKSDGLVAMCSIFFSFHIICADHFTKNGNPILISAIQFVTAAVISIAAAFIIETPSWDKIVSAAIPILYCGLMSSGVGYTCQIAGQKYSEPATASILLSMESVFAVLFGMLILHERMTMREVFGCIAMFAAVLLVQISPHRK